VKAACCVLAVFVGACSASGDSNAGGAGSGQGTGGASAVRGGAAGTYVGGGRTGPSGGATLDREASTSGGDAPADLLEATPGDAVAGAEASPRDVHSSAETGLANDGSTGADASDGRLAASVLDGFALLKPCVSSFQPTPNPVGDCCCEELAANENQHVTKRFGGDPNVTYNVKVRIAGVAERYWYAGGTLDAVSKLFYTGGLPTIHSASAPNTGLQPGQGACKIHPPETDNQFALPFAVPVEINPADGCFNGFNIFAMMVSSPKQSYYLNQTTDFDRIDRQPHQVYRTDYTVTIPIKGQASLEFFTIDGDHHQVTNDGTMTVPNVKTLQPYNGNFLEFTVVDVTRGN
jgi:hypothetical protein